MFSPYGMGAAPPYGHVQNYPQPAAQPTQQPAYPGPASQVSAVQMEDIRDTQSNTEAISPNV
jgi:hypothetical protein